MANDILNLFGDIKELNYIEYLFQIIQLVITIITFLTIFMSAHYEESIVKIQKSKMEIKTTKEIEEIRKKLIEYIYINSEANIRYESILKIFDWFSMIIFYISMICAFIYCLYLNIGAILLVWLIELVFFMTIFFVSNKLHSNKKNIIDDFFNA